MTVHVYIAGPISKDPLDGARNAILQARALDRFGFASYVPHLEVLAQMIAPREWEEWMRLDLAWLAKCDCLLRLPGESKGADLEVDEAKRLGLPVFFGVAPLVEWAAGRAP